MAQQTTIRTAFASATDAARIYGVSPNRVKDLQRVLGQFKTEARKGTVEAEKRVKTKPARRRKVSRKQVSASRKARRVA